MVVCALVDLMKRLYSLPYPLLLRYIVLFQHSKTMAINLSLAVIDHWCYVEMLWLSFILETWKHLTPSFSESSTFNRGSRKMKGNRIRVTNETGSRWTDGITVRD